MDHLDLIARADRLRLAVSRINASRDTSPPSTPPPAVGSRCRVIETDGVATGPWLPASERRAA